MTAVNPAAETLRIGAITGTGSLTKSGAGTLLLAGSNTYSGQTLVNGGTLNVGGSLANSAVTVNSSGTITGTGTVQSIAVGTGGALSGNLTATGGTTFAAGSTFNVVLMSSTNYSQLLGGTVNLTAGPTLNVVVGAGFTPPTGGAFTVIPGVTAGTFNGLQNGASFNSGGIFFRINYGSVILTPLASSISIPALSTWGLALLAILLALLASGKLQLPRGTEAPPNAPS